MYGELDGDDEIEILYVLKMMLLIVLYFFFFNLIF